MKILAIETSCDETAISLLDISGELKRPDIKVLGNTLLSQVKLHEKYGGVYPNLAKREHQKNLPILLEQVLVDSKSQNPDIDYIAVTSGPGLEPALWTGITFAEDLGKKWAKPVVPVNHMEGHIYSVLYQNENVKGREQKTKLELPTLALLVSGGHTELVLVKDFGEYEVLGQTRDDAVGEAFDKVARMLGLPYPGGPEISKLAEVSRKKIGHEFPSSTVLPAELGQVGSRRSSSEITFPRPMINSGDLNFSFSGLKTAILYHIKSVQNTDTECLENGSFKEGVAREFEDAAVEVLVAKTRQALESMGDNIKTLIVGGGVSANLHLQRELESLARDFPAIKLYIPNGSMSTDNALMIGIAAFLKVEVLGEKAGESSIKASGNLPVTSWAR